MAIFLCPFKQNNKNNFRHYIYNEEKTIVNLLQQLEQPEIASIADILVMNDASSDFTNWVVKKRNHAVVTHVFNLGYGSGL